MTHTTRIQFHDPIDAERIFGAFRAAVGVPADHPIGYMSREDAERIWHDPSNVRRLYSVPGGFRAAIDMTLDWYGESGFWVEIRLDTSYGERGCLPCLHLGFIRDALASYVSQYEPGFGISPALTFNNEMTGHMWHLGRDWHRPDSELHTGSLPAICDMHETVRVA